MIIVIIVITIIPVAVWLAEKPFEVASGGQIMMILAAILAVGYGLIKLLNWSSRKPP